MTETPDDALDLREEDPATTIAEALAPDALLKELTLHAQSTPTSRISLTLDVHGTRISGVLVGRDVWIDLLAEQEHMASVGRMAQQHFKFGTDVTNERNQSDAFLHLIDAHSVDGAGGIPSLSLPGVMWRGRLASIDGWSFGQIGVQSD